MARAFARQDKRNLSMANVKTLIHNAMTILRISVFSDKLPNKPLKPRVSKNSHINGGANAQCSKFTNYC